MKIALIDNGSLEPAAQRNLRGRRAPLDGLTRECDGFAFAFTKGLGPTADNPGRALTDIVAARVRETTAGRALRRPAVVVVDHGGPARASADLRNRVAAEARVELGAAIGPLAAASMESPDGPDFAFNLPLLADQLAAPGFNRGDVVIAPLFLSPGRHAGDGGDLARIARAAEARSPGLRCHFAGLVGTHPIAIENLGLALQKTLNGHCPMSTVH